MNEQINPNKVAAAYYSEGRRYINGALHRRWCAGAVLIGVFMATASVCAQGVSLVEGMESAERAAAVIVIPEDAAPIAAYAAEELASHIERATGVRLSIVPESAAPEGPGGRVFVGATRAAAEEGVIVTSLPPEAAVLRTSNGDLFVAGEDGPGDPLNTGLQTSGTLWGVYELLERCIGARWLWPGELGTVVNDMDTILIGALDKTVLPRFSVRHLRPGLGLRGFAQGDPRLGFSPEMREQYAHDQAVFLRRHRMGRSRGVYHAQRSFGRGHAFEQWWDRFGAEHPEWFQQLPDGTRGPDDPSRGHRVSMCVSNPEFHARIIELWQEERAKYPDETVNIGIGENDLSAACVCEACRAWDSPAPDPDILPEGLERSYLPVQASLRYARFANAVRALASTIDADVKIHYYAYLNYFWAPPEGFEMHPNIVIGFVPWFRWAGWFPRSDAEHEWIKDQWLGWKRTGASLFYRPNWFLDGYTMPHVYMHQFADAFQYYAAHGMTGSDFDTLQGMWAAQGPNLYLLARLHTRPDMPVEKLLAEYYLAFGPAAEAVADYFAYWENYSTENRERAADSIRTRRGGHFRRYALYGLVADELYPPEVFAPAFELIELAEKAASQSTNKIYAERTAFLRNGLEHARRCIEAAQVMNAPRANAGDRAAALRRLAEYRRTVEHLGIANMDRAAIIETDSWQGLEGFGDDWQELRSPRVAGE